MTLSRKTISHNDYFYPDNKLDIFIEINMTVMGEEFNKVILIKDYRSLGLTKLMKDIEDDINSVGKTYSRVFGGRKDLMNA